MVKRIEYAVVKVIWEFLLIGDYLLFGNLYLTL